MNEISLLRMSIQVYFVLCMTHVITLQAGRYNKVKFDYITLYFITPIEYIWVYDELILNLMSHDLINCTQITS